MSDIFEKPETGLIGGAPLRDRHAVVTGATDGIGRVTAMELAQTGGQVILIGRDRAKAELTIHYDGPLRAPIAKGEAVATLEIAVPGMEKATLPLYASQEVKEAGMFGRIANGFAGLFG